MSEWQIECGDHRGTVTAQTIGAAWRKLTKGKTDGFSPLARYRESGRDQRNGGDPWHYITPMALDATR